MNAPVDTTSAVDNWQRVSPWSVLHFLFEQLKQSVSIAVYVIPAFILGAHNNIPDALVPFIIAGLVVSFVVSSVLKYWFFQFTISKSGIAIRSGVLDRTYTDLPFERIQNVKFDQPFYFRFLDMLVVTLDTAGSSKQEAKFSGVTRDYAETLKHTILQARKYHQTAVQASAEDSPETEQQVAADQVINRRSLKDLILHGITNNRVWILLGAAAPFYEQGTDWVINQMTSLRPHIEQWFGSEAVTFWYVGVMTAMLVIGLMVIMALLSVGGSILMFYGYTLSKREDKYIRRSGLINRQEVSMKHSRIQVFRMQQDWLDRLLKRVNLYFEQNVTGNQYQPETKAANKLLVPSVTVEQAVALAEDVFPAQQARNIIYTGAHIRYFWRLMLIVVTPLTVVVAMLTIGFLGLYGVLLTLAFLACASAVARACWKRWGLAHDDQYIYLRKGAFGVDYWCFPRSKLQQVALCQNIFMQKRRLVSLDLVLASGRLTMPYLPQDYAYSLTDDTLAEIEQHKPGWM
ncbi:PH domain-containing protein [Alteromonas sp. AMM-1]|uniref:PH domain-containing protein n=1 Tax=Alteromonas sp. AMM-1 TaxID=3394233 RepID=UPI0039A59DCB